MRNNMQLKSKILTLLALSSLLEVSPALTISSVSIITQAKEVPTQVGLTVQSVDVPTSGSVFSMMFPTHGSTQTALGWEQNMVSALASLLPDNYPQFSWSTNVKLFVKQTFKDEVSGKTNTTTIECNPLNNTAVEQFLAKNHESISGGLTLMLVSQPSTVTVDATGTNCTFALP